MRTIWECTLKSTRYVNNFFNNIGGTTLECIIWLLVDTHKSATYGVGFDHLRVWHFHMSKYGKCSIRMWFKPRPSVTLLCVSTNDQIIHSNVLPSYNLIFCICEPFKSLASSSGNFDCILILVEHGANINTINKNKNTPLHLAAINGHHQTVEQLIRAGSTLNNQNQSGNTPLIEAVLHGHERAVSVLIQAGADIMKKNNQKVI